MQAFSFMRQLVAVSTIVLAAACTSRAPQTASPPPTQPVERWGGLLSDLRELWSAEPGIDLLTGPAVVVRAYWESIELAQSMGSLDYVYPGFTRAVAPNEPGS